MSKHYGMYPFKNQDPIVKEVLRVQAEGNLSDAYVSRKTGLCRSTLKNWKRRDGKQTKRPQFTSIRVFLRATGHDLQIVRSNRFSGEDD